MAYRSFYGNRRGGFAPRGGRGGLTHTFPKRQEWKSDLDKHPLGQLLAIFNTSNLKPNTTNLTGAATIEDCQYVASYNWVDSKSPTIMVPGKPPLWTPLKQPRRLEEDSGTYFRDPNAARFPTYPTEPAVQALFSTNPTFPTEEVDIFACGSTLGNLLRFVRRIDKPFRFSVEVIGNTVFLVRKENDPREIIEGVRGYGHTFPEAYTTWESDVKGSESHQRLVQYTFGGFKCMVRFESDGYLNGSLKSGNTSSSKSTQKLTINDLLSAFDNTAITKGISHSEVPLAIQPSGSEVPQNTIFDLKTRSGRYGKDIDMADIYPLLWLKQIPNFVIAYHDRGTFHDIRVQDVKQDVQAWKKDNKAAIERLAVLLKKIIDMAKKDDTGLLEVYCPAIDRLEIRRQAGDGQHALPAVLRAKWEGTKTDSELELKPELGDGGAGVDKLHESDDELYNEEEEYGGYRSRSGLYYDSDDEEPDYTACSAEHCGYCGKCTY